MDLRTVITDLNGRALAFLDDETFTVTARVEGWNEAEINLGRGSGLAGVLSVGSRAVQIFDGADLRFFGKVWEPLSIWSGGIKIKAHGPLAEFVQRHAQEQADYTATNNGGGPWDAGEIQFDRLATQNARRNTYLRAGTRQASANRERVVLPGTLERDVLAELSGAADGFFFRETPVEGVVGVMADLDILYPDSGTERPEITFGWGKDTADNCVEYENTTTLPRNFYTAAAAADTGGRIAKAARKALSIETYGLFEEETTYSDVTDENLLQQQADASVQREPPVTLTFTPGADAPLLFQDFDVGDFVRVHIDDPDNGLSMLEWARVLEATVKKTEGGNVLLTAISVELVVGGAVGVTPARRWRKQEDERRRRLEALERRQQNTAETQVGAPAPPAPSEPDAPAPGEPGGSPAPPPPPPPPPPPAPPEPPVITGLSAQGVNVRTNGVLHRGVEVSISVDTKGQPCDVVIDVGGGVATLGGSGTVFIAKGPGGYTVNATARTAAGVASASTSATVPAFTAE